MKKVYTKRPGPRGKRSEGKDDYTVCKSVLQTELVGLKLVSRESLQTACDARTGGKFSLQLTHWVENKKYKNGTVREAILTSSGYGRKSGIFVNRFWDGKVDNSLVPVSEKVSSDVPVDATV